MLRSAGRGLLSRVANLQRCAAKQQQQQQLVNLNRAPALSPSPRWVGTTSSVLSGHSGQLDEFGIATGAEREELEYQRQGKKRFDLDPPRGPFGTKEAPAIVESQYDVRIVGCSGGIGEDEHDVTWFHLEKDKTYECPVCTQVFQLKVIGVGGQPGHDEHH